MAWTDSWVQDPNDPKELAAQTQRLCEDPNFRRQVGENAARTALRYTWDQNGKQMKEIFMNVLRHKKVRAGTET